MTVNARAAADALHHSTKHGTAPAQPDRIVQYSHLDPGNTPAPFKRYGDLPIWPLPRTLVSSDPPAVSVLSGDRGDTSPLDSSLLGTLLYLTAGVTRTTATSGPRRTFFRAAMSAGNLHPIEVYVVAGPGIDGLAAGVHHFAPYEFGLTQVRRGRLPTGAVGHRTGRGDLHGSRVADHLEIRRERLAAPLLGRGHHDRQSGDCC